jgi:hypothetical protein
MVSKPIGLCSALESGSSKGSTCQRWYPERTSWFVCHCELSEQMVHPHGQFCAQAVTKNIFGQLKEKGEISCEDVEE